MHAAALNCLVTIPISVVSTRIQTNRHSKDGIVATFVKIFEEEGISGLWSGLQPSLVLTINPAITHLFYEKLKGLFFPLSSLLASNYFVFFLMLWDFMPFSFRSFFLPDGSLTLSMLWFSQCFLKSEQLQAAASPSWQQERHFWLEPSPKRYRLL